MITIIIIKELVIIWGERESYVHYTAFVVFDAAPHATRPCGSPAGDLA
jgi:hypothetical protein